MCQPFSDEDLQIKIDTFNIEVMDWAFNHRAEKN